MSETAETTTTTEAPLANSTEARTPTGEIRDASQTQAPPSTTTSTEPPPKVDTEAPKTPTGAPEAYTDFKVPDGYTVDAEHLASATAAFKELGLSQDAAQRLVDIQTAREVALQTAAMDTYNNLRESWRNEVKADPDLGPNLPAVKSTIAKGLEALGDPTLTTAVKDAMNLTGAGDHPAVVKALYKLSQLVTEGNHVSGRGPSPHGQTAPDAKPKSAANAMYPNLP